MGREWVHWALVQCRLRGKLRGRPVVWRRCFGEWRGSSGCFVGWNGRFWVGNGWFWVIGRSEVGSGHSWVPRGSFLVWIGCSLETIGCSLGWRGRYGVWPGHFQAGVGRGERFCPLHRSSNPVSFCSKEMNESPCCRLRCTWLRVTESTLFFYSQTRELTFYFVGSITIRNPLKSTLAMICCETRFVFL